MDRPRRDSRQHNGITLAGSSQLTFATKSASSGLDWRYMADTDLPETADIIVKGKETASGTN
jgi:hypothetical protein